MADSPGTSATGPEWALDPSDREGTTMRWWDGAAWTGRTVPLAGPAKPLPHWSRRPLAFMRRR